ncbi:S41 family peptidase [Parerythrobacter jejuensis]|nr:S41 family peptidase [Parerythrobacter jejuensis]
MARFRRAVAVAALLGLASGAASAQDSAQNTAQTCNAWAASPAGWDDIEAVIRRNYAYLDRVEDVDALFKAARASAQSAASVEELGTIAETLGYAFRDGHFHARPTVGPERAWIPSSSDFWIVRDKGRWLVSDVKQGSRARETGVRPGWEILTMDGIPIAELAAQALAAVTTTPSEAQLEYAANVVLTGRLGARRSFVFSTMGGQRNMELPPAQQSFAPRPDGMVQVSQRDGVVRLRFNNSLGNNDLITRFDQLMRDNADAKGLILDLRDTPGGGNTTVARAILGHFVGKPVPYQIHRNMFEEMSFGVRRQYAEYVFPRGKVFDRPVVILAGRWTGSVGEAVAMAFETAVGAHTVGTPLADLLGDLRTNRTGNGCIAIRFAWDKLYSVQGLPREEWTPADLLASGDTGPDGGDPALARAMQYIAGNSTVAGD